MPDPLTKYREDVKELIKGRCGDGVALLLSPPLTHVDRLASELESELGKGKVRLYILGSEGRMEKEKVKRLVKILKDIRGSMTSDKGYVVDERLMKELRDLLGDEWVRDVRPDCVIPYYISWEEARKYASDKDVDERVRNALSLIINGFEGKGRRVSWFGLDYVPEELVEEAMGAKDEDVVKRWIDDYLYIVSKLKLDGGVSHDVNSVLKRFIYSIKDFLPAIGKVMHAVPEPSTQIVATALSFVGSLAKDEVRPFRDIIDAVGHLKVLRRDGDLNTLGKLIAYKLAVDMEKPYEVVHNVLVGLAGLADGELKDIEERLDTIEIKLKSVEGAFKVYDKGGFESDAEAHPGILIKDGELLISGGVISGRAEEPYKVVTTKGFNDLRDETLKRLNDEGVVVLVGPRGIGKTTLATYATWTLFKEGRLKFVVNVKSLEEKGTEFTSFISYYLLNKYDEKYGYLLVVYDPSTMKTYSLADKKTEVPKGISSTIDALLKSIAEDEKVRGRVRLLIALPTDVYQALPQGLKDRLSKYVLDLEEKGFLRDPEFLAAVIGEYAKGCSIDDKAKELAGEISNRFSEGYTIIARLTGTLIANKYGCRVDNVERIIEESRGNAHYFILQYVNSLFKVHEEPDMAKALVEVFALRRPFVDLVRPGDPILTPGIVELIGEKQDAKKLYSAEGKELRNWLAHRQHDLIEDSIGKLLECIMHKSEECENELGAALEPWGLEAIRGSLGKVLENISDTDSTIKYFEDNYGKELTDALSDKCWRRAALIIGRALTGHLSIHRRENLPRDIIKTVGDALDSCEIDHYLLSDNKISLLIHYLTRDSHICVLTGAFIDKYDEAIDEVKKVLKIIKDRGSIYNDEGFYELGLASIIAKAARSGRPVNSSDADVALQMALFTMRYIALPTLVMPILSALEPLRNKMPQRYIKLLALASNIRELDHTTIKHILEELNKVLDNYDYEVKEHAQYLVDALIAYANILTLHLGYFGDEDEVRDVVLRVANLLNKISRSTHSLSIIAWAYALTPTLIREDVKVLVENTLGIDVVDKANEILEELSKLEGRAQELMNDKDLVGYVEFGFMKADEETVKGVILNALSFLKHALAYYRFFDGELKEAARLFNESANQSREINDYDNYLIARVHALRSEALESSLDGGELANLVKKFQQLHEEASDKKLYRLAASYIPTALAILSNYLVSLALINDDETINKLLEKHSWMLNINYDVTVLTQLTLKALLSQRDGRATRSGVKLSVNPEELIGTFIATGKVDIEFLPALRVAFGASNLEEGVESCGKFINTHCIDYVSAVKGNSSAVKDLREMSIDDFYAQISEEKVMDLLKELGFNSKLLFDEFWDLVNELDGKSLVQLIAPKDSEAQFAFMLYALINGDEKLAKAHALRGAVGFASRLSTRLFLEAYNVCCDLNSEQFRRAVAKLFFFHV
ncbi:MAG: hypothetical protein RXP86_06540 [Acidilobus sp.]